MKKVIQLTLLLLALLLPATASAVTYNNYDVQVNGIYYKLNGNNATVSCKTITKLYDDDGDLYSTSYYSDYSGSVVIPSSFYYNNVSYTVTAIGEGAFYNCSSLTNVTLPSTIATIGSSAFYGCTELVSMYLPNSVTFIGYSAFNGCTGLTDVTIGISVTTIGNYAFRRCSDLTSITIPKYVTSIGENAFSDCTSLETLNFNAISCADFDDWGKPFNNTNISTINIGNNVQKIPANFASGRTKLASVTIPNSVTSIGNSAFNGCNGLTSVTIPNSVTSIGNSAFNGCNGLTSVTIPNSVTFIGSFAFNGCTGLTSIIVGSSNTTYDSRNDCNAIIETGSNTLIQGCNNSTIPNSVISIGNSAFSGCKGLTSVTIPNSVTSIGSYAFSGCTSLETLNFNAISCADFDDWGKPFNNTNISTINIGNNVQKIPANFASGWTKLASVTVPNSVTSIGNSAFSGCNGLTSVTIPNSVTSIGSYAFSGCNGLTSITIPNSVTSIGSPAFSGCTGLTSIIVGSGNTTYDSRNDCNAIIETASNTLIQGCNNSTIPNSVTSIGNYAFSGCKGLTSVTIPNSVTSIGNYAFSGCTSLDTLNFNAVSCADFSSSSYYHPFNNTNISTINIGNNVQTIPAYFAYGLTKIASVTIPNSVTSIGNSAFQNCSSLDTLNFNAVSCADFSSSSYYHPFNNTNISTINIGNNVQTIPAYFAYGRTTLASVTIPNSVTSIGNSAFNGCSNIRNLIWNAINCSSMGNMPKTNIEQVTIGDEVQTLPSNFVSDSKITSVTIPNSVTSIGSSAFSNCTRLTSINVTDIAAWCNINFSSNTANPLYYGHHLYLNGAEVTDLNIPNSVTSIGSYAFYGCNGLTSLTIPNSVTSFGSYAFYGCTGLTSATIGNSVTTIGNNAFSNCSGLTSITIPKSVTTIGNSAFSGYNLKALIYKAVNCSSIPADAFQQGITLSSLQFGDSVQYIPAGLPTFEMVGANLLIPNSVQSIASGALSSGVCDAVVIGNGLNGLEAGTFSEGIKVAYVSNAEPIPSAPAAFADPQTLYVPGGSKVKYWTAQGWNEFKEIIQGPYIPVDVLAIDSEISMPKGSTRQLAATISPTDATATSIKWFSKDATIATVDNNGVIQAIDHGETDIYAVVDTVMAICHVNVNVALVETLTLNATQLLLEPDDIFTLIATANPDYAENKAVEWEIPENDVIVHFINGNSINIGTLQEGTVTVTAHAVDGSNSTASCVITVQQDIVHATSIELNQTSAGLNEGETLQLTATVMPEDATDKSVTWTSSDVTVASVDQNGLVTAVAAGNATITASTIDGSELTATCEVTVNGTTLNNSLDADGMRVYCGEEKALAVRMNNESSITAVQCDIYLPEGISIATEDGDYLIDLDPTRKASNHTVSTNDLPNGAIRLFITSATSKPFKGNSGDLFVLNLVVADDAESGDYSLDLRNVILSDTEAHPYYAPDLNVPISIRDYIKGDVNSDRTVNVSDYVATANYILELDPHPFLFAAADIDENGTINVSDLVGVANIALNFMGASIIYHAPATGYEGPEQMVLAADCNTVASGKRVVTLDLSNSTAVTAFQMDITLPDGMSLVGASLSDRATASHSLEMTTLASGAYRLLGASMMSKAFADNEGTLLTLEIEGTASGVVVIDGIMVAEPNTTLHELGAMTLTFDASSIQETRSDVRIYTQDGMVVVESPVTDKVQFILPNGISVVKEVKAGRNVYRTGLNGIVMVKVGEQVKKFKM